MVWSAIARFGTKLLQGAKAGKDVATLAAQGGKLAYKTGGVRAGIKAFGDDAVTAYRTVLSPAQRSALKTTAVTAAAVPLANGLLNSGGSAAPQGYR